MPQWYFNSLVDDHDDDHDGGGFLLQQRSAHSSRAYSVFCTSWICCVSCASCAVFDFHLTSTTLLWMASPLRELPMKAVQETSRASKTHPQRNSLAACNIGAGLGAYEQKKSTPPSWTCISNPSLEARTPLTAPRSYGSMSP